MESPASLPKFAFNLLDEAENAYQYHNKFPDDVLGNLCAIFGDIFLHACEMIESYKFRTIRYQTEDGSRCIYKVSNHKEQFTIYEDQNFCFCPTFKTDVLELQKCVTCKHVLVVKICRITGNLREEKVKSTQLSEFLNQHLNYLEDSKLV